MRWIERPPGWWETPDRRFGIWPVYSAATVVTGPPHCYVLVDSGALDPHSNRFWSMRFATLAEAQARALERATADLAAAKPAG